MASMAKDSRLATSVATTIAARLLGMTGLPPLRRKLSASRNPNGAYPTRLAATSKPVQYLGQGLARNAQGAMPWSRQPVKGYRLA